MIHSTHDSNEADEAQAPDGAVSVPEIHDTVSVAVPSFNHARFVERTLRSVFAQTLRPAELLVIDDGSTDGSPKIIERALAECPFPCELIARENRGLAKTLNEALASATRGRFFAYLGSDDIWLPEFLAARSRLLEERPHAVLGYGHAYYIDAEDRIIDRTDKWADYTDGDVRAMLWRGVAPHSPTVVYRRAALARYGWSDRARLEDYGLYLRLAEAGEFAFDPRLLAAWRIHAANTSRDFAFMMDEWLDAQRSVAAEIGLASDELARAQAQLGWSCAENFARRGAKREAMRLAFEHRHGAPSAGAVAKMMLRLAIPHALLSARRVRSERETTERHGTIQLGESK